MTEVNAAGDPPGWGVYDLLREAGEVHVIHTTEVERHVQSRACICGPTVKVEHESWIVLHRRLP